MSACNQDFFNGPDVQFDLLQAYADIAVPVGKGRVAYLACSLDAAIGFSTRTCFPARSAVMARSK